MKTALLIGATGLVGSHLLDILVKDDRFDKIKVFTRKSTGKGSNKIEELSVDFDNIRDWAFHLTGEVLFSTLGTTIKKAGSKDAQYKIDFTYQYEVAKQAAQNGVSTYVLISSAGADPKSKVFYSRMKGELETAIAELPYKRIRIIQPGILDGDRAEARPMEKLAIHIARGVAFVPGIKKYRPIHAETVAKAMINASFDDSAGTTRYTLEEVFTLAAG